MNSPSRVGGDFLQTGEGDLEHDGLWDTGLHFLIGFLILIFLSTDLDASLVLRVLRSSDTDLSLLALFFLARVLALALASSAFSSV